MRMDGSGEANQEPVSLVCRRRQRAEPIALGKADMQRILCVYAFVMNYNI